MSKIRTHTDSRLKFAPFGCDRTQVFHAGYPDSMIALNRSRRLSLSAIGWPNFESMARRDTRRYLNTAQAYDH